ncbi:hypothetical protein VP01_5562g1 [Puccinia sorghi]|uniref:Uncharacterized protein n=1 Tax=Puccinia sorghi TaxID=27349 RepID=A0A0L6UJ57_9BASI|nr:hypothetical protein VP01_5562g1 [Puccinia sorghi]
MAEHIYFFQKWIASQSSAFKSEYLPIPSQLGQARVNLTLQFGELNCISPVISVVLLTCSPASHQHQTRIRLTRDSVQLIETIQQQWTSHLKIQVALLQMVTAHHYFHRPPGDASSQWDIIDDYLEILRTWGLVQKQATLADFYQSQFCHCQDQQLFNGREMIEDIKRQDICLPTEDKVEELRVSMATQGAGAVNQLLDDETAAS